MLTAIVTAALAFAATNIDDIVLLTMWFGSAGGILRGRHIVAGQYVGFAVLVAVSLLGALGALLVPRGVAFEEKNVREDPGAFAEMQEIAGVRIAPVTLVGDQAFYGTFENQRPHIEAALKEYA